MAEAEPMNGRSPRRRRMLARAGGVLVFAAVLLATLAVGWRTWQTLSFAPRTTDAEIAADVVRMSAAVPGRLTELAVADNARVEAGALLFRVDPVFYREALELAEAELAVAEAELDEARRLVRAEGANAVAAAEEVERARANLDLAQRTLERLAPMESLGYVSRQMLDEAETAVLDAGISLRQALEASRAAEQEVQSTRALEAQVRAARAAVAIASSDLDKTAVYAPVDGRVAGLEIAEGEFLEPGVPVFTLIDDQSWHARALFRETELEGVQIGDRAEVYVMIDQHVPIAGRVAGIGWGVVSDDALSLLGDLPYVKRTLNWVRVAARFPVRVELESPPRHLLRAGASAVVILRERDD